MITITGVLEDSVLLPCNCSERNLDKEFKWQMEEPNKTLVLKYDNNTLNFYGRYTGRAEIFLPENSNNCSLLLTNITADDRGKYRCSFNSKGIYQKTFVYLNISGESVIRHAYLQYLLIHSLTHEFTVELQSNLNSSHLSPATSIIKLNGTPRPAYGVKAKGVSTIITSGDTAESGNPFYLFQRRWDLHTAHYDSTLKELY